MSALTEVVPSSLAAYYTMIRNRIHELVDPLPEEQIWRRPYPYGNSIGNLLLHLTGNLNYYIGAQIAATGYVRHRDSEFSETGKPKAEILTNFDRAVDMVVKTINQQSASDWSAAYSAVGTHATDRFNIVLICAAHANHHVGQIIYLQKELNRTRAQAAD